jgi:GT2 family glycosyltransferase
MEVIAVDDGGDVPLVPVVEALKDRIEVTLHVQERRGPAAARNAGARLASGELLAFVDDDCLADRSWLLALAQRHVREPTATLGGRTVNALGENLFAAVSQHVLDLASTNGPGGAGEPAFLGAANLAIPAADFAAIGGFREDLQAAEDRELCHRLRSKGVRVAFVEDAIVRHKHDLTLADFCRRHFKYGRGAECALQRRQLWSLSGKLPTRPDSPINGIRSVGALRSHRRRAGQARDRGAASCRHWLA